MSQAAESQEDAPRKKSRLPLIVGLVLALAGGGGGFYAVQSGLILGEPSDAHADPADRAAHDEAALPLPSVAFVELEPLVINLGQDGQDRHLRFRAHLEVVPKHEAEVTKLVPRVLDVLNGYLRAVSVTDLQDPGALVRLRAQMLRRIKIVTGEGRVRDLLVMEFVLN